MGVGWDSDRGIAGMIRIHRIWVCLYTCASFSAQPSAGAHNFRQETGHLLYPDMYVLEDSRDFLGYPPTVTSKGIDARSRD